ncbi:MAG: C4-type zinc ribbon domain-containing protein [Actinomycetota bacterium]|nr:C4-type zinc ribbon domain-containing protein [Actinomycetota bacterium]
MAGDADPTSLQLLLEVQFHDSGIARLSHQRDNLPESQRLAEVSDHLGELEADLEIAHKQLEELTREQDRIEGEIGILESKIEREELRLFSGAVSNPKELSALQAEVAMLKKNRGDLEDSLLEVMVQKDQATATADRLESEHESTQAEHSQLAAKVRELSEEIDAELNDHAAKRSEVAARIPRDLVALYESLRDSKGGIGAAALRGDTCEGCHTKLPSREVERLRNEGGLQRCDNCRRILVVV